MNTEVFPETAPDFSNPIGLLVACHNKILQHCDLLERLLETWQAEGQTADVNNAANRVARYFSTAGKLHHQDEEKDFFPILSHQSLKLADSIHHLKLQHAELDKLWADLEPQLRRLSNVKNKDTFAAKAAAFCQLSREHLKLETEDFLSIAPHILSQKQLNAIGDAMAERRGVRRA